MGSIPSIVNGRADTQTNFTMRCLILSCLVALTLAQTPPAWFSHIKDFINGIDGTIDIVHGYRVEYHHDGRQHLLILIKDEDYGSHHDYTDRPGGSGHHGKACHFVEVSPVWEHLLKDQSKVPQISEEIIHNIYNHDSPESVLTLDQLQAAYGASEAVQECAGHSIRVLSYSPSAAIMSS